MNIFKSIHRTKQILFSLQYSSISSFLKSSSVFNVESFGNLFVHTKDTVNIHIKSLDPQLHPNQNMVCVETNTGSNLNYIQSGNNIHISSNEFVTHDHTHGQCEIQVPIKFDIDVVIQGDKSLLVEGLENYNNRIEIDKGRCTLKKLQTEKLNVKSNGGDIICEKAVQASSTLQTCSSGCINGDKMLGTLLQAKTENGNIYFKAVYTDNAKFSSVNGNIHLKNCQSWSSAEISRNSNLKIDTFEGRLHAKVNNGDISLYATRHEDLCLESENGNITLFLPESIQSAVSIDSPNMVIENPLKLKNGIILHEDASNDQTDFDPFTFPQKSELHDDIKISALNGNVTIKCLNWLQSLNLS